MLHITFIRALSLCGVVLESFENVSRFYFGCKGRVCNWYTQCYIKHLRCFDKCIHVWQFNRCLWKIYGCKTMEENFVLWLLLIPQLTKRKIIVILCSVFPEFHSTKWNVYRPKPLSVSLSLSQPLMSFFWSVQHLIKGNDRALFNVHPADWHIWLQTSHVQQCIL